MILQPGCRVVIAPHFQMATDWSRRLLIGSGVEEVNGCFFPRPSWRPPTSDELALLLDAPEGSTSPEELATSVCLFQLPEHLRSQWWTLLEKGAGALGDGSLPGFETFVKNVVEFLDFKELQVPEGARCNLVVSNAGQRSADWRPGARGPEGLRCHTPLGATRPGVAELRGPPPVWGGINLGTEETSLVLINLPCRQLEAELRRRFPDQPPADGELGDQFLRFCPDYPPVRLILRPGEGCRLPCGGLILDSYLADKQDPDVLLLISLSS
jgi:hypothetical protein